MQMHVTEKKKQIKKFGCNGSSVTKEVESSELQHQNAVFIIVPISNF